MPRIYCQACAKESTITVAQNSSPCPACGSNGTAIHSVREKKETIRITLRPDQGERKRTPPTVPILLKKETVRITLRPLTPEQLAAREEAARQAQAQRDARIWREHFTNTNKQIQSEKAAKVDLRSQKASLKRATKSKGSPKRPPKTTEVRAGEMKRRLEIVGLLFTPKFRKEVYQPQVEEVLADWARARLRKVPRRLHRLIFGLRLAYLFLTTLRAVAICGMALVLGVSKLFQVKGGGK